MDEQLKKKLDDYIDTFDPNEIVIVTGKELAEKFGYPFDMINDDYYGIRIFNKNLFIFDKERPLIQHKLFEEDE